MNSIYFIKQNLSFPVMIIVSDEWEKVKMDYLRDIVKNNKMTTLSICQWCENHDIKYDVIFSGSRIRLLFIDPKRFLCYLYLKQKGVSSIRLHI